MVLQLAVGGEQPVWGGQCVPQLEPEKITRQYLLWTAQAMWGAVPCTMCRAFLIINYEVVCPSALPQMPPPPTNPLACAVPSSSQPPSGANDVRWRDRWRPYVAHVRPHPDLSPPSQMICWRAPFAAAHIRTGSQVPAGLAFHGGPWGHLVGLAAERGFNIRGCTGFGWAGCPPPDQKGSGPNLPGGGEPPKGQNFFPSLPSKIFNFL